MGSFVRKIDFHTIAKSPSGYFLCFRMYTIFATYPSSRLRKRNEDYHEHYSQIRMQCFILLIKKILIEGPIITSFYVNLPY